MYKMSLLIRLRIRLHRELFLSMLSFLLHPSPKACRLLFDILSIFDRNLLHSKVLGYCKDLICHRTARDSKSAR